MKRSHSQSSLHILYCAVFVLYSTLGVAFAQTPEPLGDIFPVNETITDDQSTPEVDTDFDGAFVSVWMSAGQDGSGTGIFGQFFDEDGNEQGLEFQVNDTTEGDQTDPIVSMGDDESFAVVWLGPDGDGTGIFLRMFDEDGATTLTDIQVNDTTVGIQSNPDVALAEDGQVLVVWQSPDGDGEGVFGRFFDFDGVALSVELPIPTSTAGDQTEPDAEDVDEDGSFVVAWEGLDAEGRGIFAQQLDDTGSMIGGEIAVNTTTAGDQTMPVLGNQTDDDAVEDNGFIIVWQGPDAEGFGIFAQFFDEDGNPSGTEVQVNPDPAGDQTDPDVTIDDEGDFVVTWTEPDPQPLNADLREGSRGLVVSKGSPILIRGRRFTKTSFTADPSLSRGGLGSEVFDVASGVLQRPSIAAEANGDFVVIWQDANDGGGSGIFGQRFKIGLFSDGFETGDTTMWSSVSP